MKSPKQTRFYELGKGSFLNFVDALIKKDLGRVIGVKARGNKFIFDGLDSAEELRLDQDVTVLPPKKYFLPATESMLRYRLKEFSVQEVFDATPLIIIGIHPYDLVALEQMDVVLKETNPDYRYLRRREEAILIGVNMQKVSPHAFAGSMGTATTDHGFDLMLTDLGDRYAIEVGSEKGQKLLENYANATSASPETIAKVRSAETEILSKFERRINFSPKELPELLEKNYNNELWSEKAKKCLKCGSCNLVCPTCYCFDVQDVPDLNLKGGERVRKWDGCLLEDFAKVATGENFRSDMAGRYRHRFMRKGKYIHDKFGFIACVGCGRCSSACLPDIADPTDVFNSLKEAAA
jgi:ferredoxin